jgi:nucleoside-diphosphate-sugar epimerase
VTGRVLVAGCGYVGSQAAGRLVARGCEVFGLRRRPRGLPDGVVSLAADLADPDSLADLPPGLDLVLYAASAGGGDEAAYQEAYVDGPRNLLEALERCGQAPRRVLFTSSTSVYAQTGGAWVDEDSPTEPPHPTGRLLLAGERVFRDGPFQAILLRLGGIYGPGRTRLAESVLEGSARLPGDDGPRWTNRIHRDDAAGALVHLACDVAEPAPVYLGVDREPAELAAVLGWLAAELGVPEPLPGPAAAGRRVRGNRRCSSRRLVASGYRHRFPTFREGYAPLLAELRAREA